MNSRRGGKAARSAAGGPPAEPPARPEPAASAVLLRPGQAGLEVLLTRRPSTMAFGPDIHVFPGGRVEPEDSDPGRLAAAGITAAEAAACLGLGLAPDPGLTPDGALALHLAAVRETAEETGITIEAAELIPLARWVTPISFARRFDARFFAAFVAPGTEVLDGSVEVVDARWMAPEAALEAGRRGEIALWQPTFVTLQQLAGVTSPAGVRASFAVGSASGGPRIERRRPDLARVDAAWAGGIPGRRAGGWLVGGREVVVVDPADPTGVTSDAILAEVAAVRARIAGVVISGLAPERHAGAGIFAHGLGLPVAAAAGTVAGAPYPVIEMDARDALPFGDLGLTLEAALRPA